jgi:signal peptidase I
MMNTPDDASAQAEDAPQADAGTQADVGAPAEGAPPVETGPQDKSGAEGKAGKRGKSRKFYRELAIIVAAAIILTLLIKAFVVQVYRIPSDSMDNTLLPGDRVLVNKLIYHFRGIARGDIVVFSGAGSWDPPAQPPSNWLAGLLNDATNLVGIAGPDTDYVKRVIGVPGDHVVCCNAGGQVTVNGVPLSESSYVFPGDAPSDLRFNITVPPGRLWVMGDNRGDSDDSRYRGNDPGQGTIPESAVVGRAFLIIWPLSRVSDLPIPNTLEQAGLSAAAGLAVAPPATVAGGTALAGAAALTWRRRRRRGPGAG